jgi:hypothetical protein
MIATIAVHWQVRNADVWPHIQWKLILDRDFSIICARKFYSELRSK